MACFLSLTSKGRLRRGRWDIAQHGDGDEDGVESHWLAGGVQSKAKRNITNCPADFTDWEQRCE